MGLLKAANSTALQWVDVEKAPYPSNYQPVMALAQNHVFFLNVPSVSAGSADIYVIHCESGPYFIVITGPPLTYSLCSRQLLPASGAAFPNVQWDDPCNSWPDRVILPKPRGTQYLLLVIISA